MLLQDYCSSFSTNRTTDARQNLDEQVGGNWLVPLREQTIEKRCVGAASLPPDGK